MAKRYSVVPSVADGWAVREESKVAGTFKTKSEALSRVRALAAQAGGEIVVYGRDGKIQSTTVWPQGYGVLRGQYAAREGIDLTKPIYEQVRRKALAKR